MNRIKFFLLGAVLVGLSSCYREVELPPGPDMVFELLVSPEMQEFIYSSRDSSFTISEQGMDFRLGDQSLDLDKIWTRGKSALWYQRKSYAVKLDAPAAITGRDGVGTAYLSRFKLIALAMDFTYIENRIAFGLLSEQGIMPLFYRFVEFKINGDTQGIYLLVEDPEQFYLENDSEYILRRGYFNGIDDSEYAPSSYGIDRELYKSRFMEIYSSLSALEGEELYSALNDRLDMEQYFRKMGIDYLLQNGDYTDELYFYALIEQDKIRFRIIPWDYDDLFKSDPHEVGRNWATGKIFGDRYYDTYQDVLDEIGDKIIFSIEDDLDYTIAMDPYLYSRYESTLAAMIGSLEGQDIDAIFEQLKQELLPFYMEEELVMQSRFDQDETSFEIWENNMEEKKTLIKDRLAQMKEQLKNSQL